MTSTPAETERGPSERGPLERSPSTLPAPRGPREATRYQRQRLWCGIVGIGLVLNGLWWGTFLGLTRLPAMLPAWPLPIVCGLTAMLLGCFVALLQWPVDRYAQRVERAFGQMSDARLVRRTHVVRTLEWVGSIALAGVVFGAIVQHAGDAWPVVGGLLLGGIGLVVHVVLPLSPGRPQALDARGQAWLERVREALRSLGHPLPSVALYDHGERSLAGGWHGVGPWRRLMLTTTLADVPPRLAAGLILREIAHARLGHRIVSVWASLLWTTLGLVIAGLTAPAWTRAPSDAGLVVWVGTVMSTWGWLGLFVWPALGRRQIRSADAFAARAMGRDDAIAMLDLLAERNLPDESLPPAVAWVFHPIPPMATRRAAIVAMTSSPATGDDR